MCHGAQGLSLSNAPNLAGQYPEVVITQLHDYKSGKRRNAVMESLAQQLGDRESNDLAAYYAYLPRLPGYHPEADLPAPRIVVNGAPLRNIAPCVSCHGGIDQ
jgi:cytochrome c553